MAAQAHLMDAVRLVRLLPDIVALCLEEGTDVEDYLSELEGEPKWEAWWRLVHTSLEVKKDNGDVPSILHTFKHGRQTLKEQPDRRFVFALIFTRSEIRFWLLDRSGALGSELVDIHTNPKTLIRIVVGLMTKSPSDLGWDPTMLQYVDGERKPSYNIPRTMKSRYHLARERKWSVMMPKPKPRYTTDTESKLKPAPVVADPNAEMEEFTLHRAIHLSRAEVIRGRCTRIWLAWLASDMGIDERERKVSSAHPLDGQPI
ncbi:hypothetical protein OF83DRAFT_359186 [Amylostereum chailletii]|nr:hypothetical protein OF83DRAFT_359186 [Amylostereum chailletii]